jgi:cytochrome c oxidase subunit 2
MFVDEDEDVVVMSYMHNNLTGKDIQVMTMFCKANVRYIEGANVVGVDLADPYAQDDFVVTELHIPKGKNGSLKCNVILCHGRRITG